MIKTKTRAEATLIFKIEAEVGAVMMIVASKCRSRPSPSGLVPGPSSLHFMEECKMLRHQ